MSLKKALLLSFILVVGNASLLAQNPGNTPPKFAPPWVMQSSNFLMAAFSLKASDVTPLLPKGMEPLANKDGMVQALLEVYETSQVSGLPNYKIAFIVVDVKGHDSRENTPGHFAVWGRVTPREALDAFRGNFAFPYDYADIGFSAEGDAHIAAIGAAGKEILKVKMVSLQDQPFSGQGAVNMVGMNADSGAVKSEVPYITRGHMAKVIAFEVRAKGDPVLKLIKDAAPVWALVSKDQTFSYSHAVFSD
jgi:hypothetical protein